MPPWVPLIARLLYVPLFGPYLRLDRLCARLRWKLYRLSRV